MSKGDAREQGQTATTAQNGPAATARPRRFWQRTMVQQFALLIFLLGTWEVTSGRLFDDFWVSRPSAISAYLYTWIVTGDFWRHFWATLSEVAIGFTLGAVVGLAVGLPLGRAEQLARVLDPFLLALNGIPRVALAPLFVIWFGIGILPKIILVFTLVFFVVFYNTYAGVRYVEKRFIDIAWVMGAGERALFAKVILPAALPFILLGLKLSIPYAVIGAIIGEFIASSEGLGYKIMVETSLYNTTGTMAGIFVLMILVVILNSLLGWFEARALRWRPQTTSRGGDVQGL